VDPFPHDLDTQCLKDVERTVLSMRKALRCGGRFLSVSFASPMLRLPLLAGVFRVTVSSFVSPHTGFEYYVYECEDSLKEDQVDFHRYLEAKTVETIPVDIPENDIFSISLYD